MNRKDPEPFMNSSTGSTAVQLKDRPPEKKVRGSGKKSMEIAPEWKKDRVALRLRSIQRRERLYHALGILIACACFVIIYLLAEIVIDRAWELDASVRAMLLKGAIILVSVSGLIFGFRVLTRAGNPLRYAREVDRMLGIDDDVLITYVDLARRRDTSPTERTVVALLEADALSRLKRLDVDHVINIRGLVWAGRILGGLCVLWIIYALLCGSTFFLSVKRAVMPWRNLTVPHQTRIVSFGPGSRNVLSGAPVTFWLQANGALPEQARLKYSVPGVEGKALQKSVVMKKLGSGKYTATLSSITQSMSYFLACNDSRTKSYNLTLVDRPLVTSVSVIVLPPSHASHLKRRTVSGGHVTAMLGSRIDVLAQVNQEVMDAVTKHPLKFGKYSAWLKVSGRKIPMKVEGRSLRGSFVLQRNLTYQVLYVAKNEFVSSDGVRYQALIRNDAPPMVLLKRADAIDGTPLGPQDVAIFKAHVTDDLGVRKIVLRYGVEGRIPQTMDCSPGTPTLKHSFPIALDLSTLKLRSGQVLVCTLHAKDIRVPVPNRGKSIPVRIPILKSKAPKRGDPKVAKQNLKSEDPFKDLIEKLKEAARQKDNEGSSEKDAGAEDSSTKGRSSKEKDALEQDAKRTAEIGKAVEAIQKQEAALHEKMKQALKKRGADSAKDDAASQRMADEQQRIAKQLANLIKALESGGSIPTPGSKSKTPKEGDADVPSGQKKKGSDGKKPADSKETGAKKSTDKLNAKGESKKATSDGKESDPGKKATVDAVRPAEARGQAKKESASKAGDEPPAGSKSKKGAESKESKAESSQRSKKDQAIRESDQGESKRDKNGGAEGKNEGQKANEANEADGAKENDHELETKVKTKENGAKGEESSGDDNRNGKDDDSPKSKSKELDASKQGGAGTDSSGAGTKGEASGVSNLDAPPGGAKKSEENSQRPNGRQRNAMPGQDKAKGEGEGEGEGGSKGEGEEGGEGNEGQAAGQSRDGQNKGESKGADEQDRREGGPSPRSESSPGTVNGREDKRARGEAGNSKLENADAAEGTRDAKTERIRKGKGNGEGRDSRKSETGEDEGKSGKSEGGRTGSSPDGGSEGKGGEGEGGRSMEGQPRSEQRGHDATPEDGGGSGGAESDKPPPSGPKSSLSPKEKNTLARLKYMQDRLREATSRLRERAIDSETLGLSKEVVDGLNGFGRTMSESDKQGIQKKADDGRGGEGSSKSDAEAKAATVKGRVRKELLGGQGSEMEQIRSSGEVKVDKLKRLIEAGQKKVVPEYRRPLEEYYKAVAD